jgi:hypothetical protein
MGLSDRLKSADPRRSNTLGCAVCRFHDSLPEEDQAEFGAWISAGQSRAQLYHHCCDEGLNTSLSLFQNCIREHRQSV